MISRALVVGAVGMLAWPFAAGASPADSAAVARQAWREAVQAKQKGDRLAAMLKAERAHQAWPMQWYYAYGLALLAAEAGEPSTTARALDDLAALGSGIEFLEDTTLVALGRANISVATALEKVAGNRAPLVHSTTRIEFPPADSAFYPEGIASDPRTGRLFVAGIRGHKVAVIEQGKAPRDFASVGSWAALAAAVDSKRGRLWVTSCAIPQAGAIASADTGRAAIQAFDLATGKLIVRHDLPPSREGHTPGDLAVAPNGDVYVSDSTHPAVYRLRVGAKGGSAPEEWLTDPAFRSLQGQAITPDGRTLYLADSSHGIAAIDLATKAVRWLEPPAGMSVLGIDGMALYRGDLVAVQNGVAPARIVRLALAGATPKGPATRIAALKVLDRNVPLADEPTLGVVDGDAFVYVANSQWEKYDERGARRHGIALTSPRLMTVPLARKL